MAQNELTLEQKFEIKRMRGSQGRIRRTEMEQLLQEARRLQIVKTQVLNQILEG